MEDTLLDNSVFLIFKWQIKLKKLHNYNNTTNFLYIVKKSIKMQIEKQIVFRINFSNVLKLLYINSRIHTYRELFLES